MFEQFTRELREAAKVCGEPEPPWYDVRAHRARAARTGLRSAQGPGPFIVVSRLPGAGGGTIARRVGEALGWPVLGKELLGRITERFHVDPDLLEMIDESTSNFLYDAFGHLLDRNFISHSAYVAYLRKTVCAAAAEGPAVFVGRGAQYFLPRRRSLLVRIVADERDRIERFERHYHVDRKLAEKIVAETTQQRAAFIRRHFHHDVDEAGAYDLTVNSSRLGFDGCAEAIVAALRSSGVEQNVATAAGR